MTDEEIVRWWECERKLQRFDTFTDANDHAWQIERAQFKDWHAVHAYQCIHCGGFHIGRAQLGRRHGWGRRLEHARHAEINHDTSEPGWRRRHGFGQGPQERADREAAGEPSGAPRHL
jgi:hypothetical protein